MTHTSSDLAQCQVGQQLTDQDDTDWTKRPDSLWESQDGRLSAPTVLARRTATIHPWAT